MKKIGVLTTIEANHGSCIFNASLNKLISDLDVQNDIRFMEFLNPKYRLKELFRTLKINKGIPFYNFKRNLTLMRIMRGNLSIEAIKNLHTPEGLMRELNARDFNTLIVAKVVWDIARNAPYGFPNIYWLSEKIRAKKIAYAVSGHRTDLIDFREQKKKVHSALAGFQLIGVRDKMTRIMMEEAGIDRVVPVHQITDPAFFYEQHPVDFQALCKKHGIPGNRPVLGLLYYGKPGLSKIICEHFHKKGYLIINFNMLNLYADINIGHLVNLDEWVELIRHLDFCITDRFHVSVFCLRANIPFTAIEPYRPATLLNSKVFSLLEDFGMEKMLYQDPYEAGFNFRSFISTCEGILANWERQFSGVIRDHLLANNRDQKNFLSLVKQIIESN